MQTSTVELVFFSPTGTTRSVSEAIARGLGTVATLRDLTLPHERLSESCHTYGEAGTAIIAVPVYAGRVPTLAADRLRAYVRGLGRPAVLVVVYGNRAYEDALLELRDLTLELGFQPVAAAAFVGEHSFSTPEWPVAQGRPDDADLEAAETFGRTVGEFLHNAAGAAALFCPQIPGNFPYRDGVQPAAISPETDPAECMFCGDCTNVCPMGIISLEIESVDTDKTRCLRCCACVRACVSGARAMRHPRIVEFARTLHSQCTQRRQPDFFL